MPLKSMVIKLLIKLSVNAHPHVSNSNRPLTVLLVRPRENYPLSNPFDSIHSSSYAYLCCLLSTICTRLGCRNTEIMNKKKIILIQRMT